MLIEKYMEVKVEVPDMKDEYAPPETYYEEVYVKDSDIKHYIDMYMSAEDVLNYAKQIASEEFDGENAADLDLAYDILIDEFDEHDDIKDFEDLNEFIQDCIQQDYEEEAAERVTDQLDSARSDQEEIDYYIRTNMPR